MVQILRVFESNNIQRAQQGVEAEGVVIVAERDHNHQPVNDQSYEQLLLQVESFILDCVRLGTNAKESRELEI